MKKTVSKHIIWRSTGEPENGRAPDRLHDLNVINVGLSEIDNAINIRKIDLLHVLMWSFKRTDYVVNGKCQW